MTPTLDGPSGDAEVPYSVAVAEVTCDRIPGTHRDLA